ncbi:MAG TPA: hypothetical protein VNA89_13660 [Gemmatimonadaceae bacterium]|nr:hypothetical protein [Gemmatimonadaceae bacterium]
MATILRTAVLTAALATAAACGKGGDTAGGTSDRTATAGGAIATADRVRVTDVSLGRGVNADNTIRDETGDFRPADQIYAVVKTEGAAATSARLTARWTFEDGQVVEETTQEISPAAEAYSQFIIRKPSGWPKGKYALRVLLDGAEVEKKDFEVR